MPSSVLDPPQVEELYRTLEEKVRALRPKEDLKGLDQAYRFAAEHHKNQRRKSGEPYIAHPLAVTHLLADMQMDLVCLETGLLHDVLEDTTAKPEQIREQFGEDVARCVDGVTKLSKIKMANREDRQAESLRKMLLAMTGDIRVIIVKLADRLHNMRTIGWLSRERQEAIAQETIDVYAPIAHRLGMGKVRGELEDLSFQALHPEAAADLMHEINMKRQEHEEWLRQVQTQIEQKLWREDVPARVEGRVKRAYSVYQKLKRQKITLDQVYDVLAMRIITDSVKNCYAALGIIHNEWHPIPGRIKDFIAMPRPNLYQSLHTSVIGPG
ncbi:MAG: bifunctional (p)ppGpp synthetase/guanosine-3',5'-bis(diphosphate) 3'-pyrophosphohydrolase, partial [Acidobacteriaceae bacterium]|nr:bifunctional (p)ppGpp synthetase/guanosine-3',5'-bis(diphosphate) 3'-pyrophosphohydrolase [Acidobacteriaceae bacterium]